MKTIYICCPAGSYTGGPTLAHQLCYILNSNGFSAKMWYYCNPLKKRFINPVHPNYKHMNNPYVINTPKDSKESIIVAIESKTSILWRFKNAERYIWWMSVDNYYLNMGNFGDYVKRRFFKFKPTIEYCKQYKNKKKYLVFKEKDVRHLVQSEYAREFLITENINCDSIRNLSDYLEEEVLKYATEIRLSRTDNIVLYNPKKGYEFTKKIIERAPQFKWVPLVNLTKEQVSNLLLDSKVYIDFGNHPGKDRFPREAVICGCCLITGKRGAAKNNIDIPISDKYKFSDIDEEIPLIIDKISYIMNNYQKCIKDFEIYKERILEEKNTFMKEVMEIFGEYKK